MKKKDSSLKIKDYKRSQTGSTHVQVAHTVVKFRKASLVYAMSLGRDYQRLQKNSWSCYFIPSSVNTELLEGTDRHEIPMVSFSYV